MERDYSYDEFRDIMPELVGEYFEGCDARIEVHKVLKNNSRELDGLVIINGEGGVSPNFYLNFYYDEYLRGRSIEDIAIEIKEKYDEMELEEIWEFNMALEECEDKIVCRLVSYERNGKLLKNIPYVRFLDMAIIFYCLVLEDENGIGSIRISNSMADEWHLTSKMLYQIAIYNTTRLFPKAFCPLKFVLQNTAPGGRVPHIPDFSCHSDICAESEPPYILTNSRGINGAAVMLYPECLKEVRLALGTDLYIIPCSIHELLIVPDNCGLNPEELGKMVHDVNESCVVAEEVLSENIYHYSFAANSVEICGNKTAVI